MNDYAITHVSTKRIRTDDIEDASCSGNSQIIRHDLERKFEFHYEQDDLAENETDEDKFHYQQDKVQNNETDEDIFYDTGKIHPVGVDHYVPENRVIISNLAYILNYFQFF